MALPLDRTWYNTLVDDDGSGTTGTVWNKTAVDGLMDTIDARLVGIVDRADPPAGFVTAAGLIDTDTVTPQPAIQFDNVTGGLSITSAGNFAYLEQIDASQPANARRFRTVNTNGALQISAVSDAGVDSPRVTISRAGAVSMPGGLALPTTGHISFPGTATPSPGPTVFDDYREGTFQTWVRGTGGQSGQVYGDRTGLYTKTGREVTCIGHVFLSTTGTVLGTVVLGDLPFPSVSAVGASGIVGHWGGLSGPVSMLTLFLAGGLNYAFLRYSPVGGSATAIDLPSSMLSSPVEFNFAITYFTDY